MKYTHYALSFLIYFSYRKETFMAPFNTSGKAPKNAQDWVR